MPPDDHKKKPKLPPWLRVPFTGARERQQVRRLLRDLNLHTVCESALCPNLCECWERRTATFMILGDVCSRNCCFCKVASGTPSDPDPDEPAHICEAVAQLGLKFVVLTSVTRDDLPDGGSAHFAAVVTELRGRYPEIGIEVLTPDFGGSKADIDQVLEAGPNVFNHNIETCSRLTPEIRSGADYRRSISVLEYAARSRAGRGVLTKSGFMLGLGETADEIDEMLRDLKQAGVNIVTIGQYLPPSREHWPVERYISPEEFTEWGDTARERYGFDYVVSAPLVRSSYMAEHAVSGDDTGKAQGRGTANAEAP